MTLAWTYTWYSCDHRETQELTYSLTPHHLSTKYTITNIVHSRCSINWFSGLSHKVDPHVNLSGPSFLSLILIVWRPELHGFLAIPTTWFFVLNSLRWWGGGITAKWGCGLQAILTLIKSVSSHTDNSRIHRPAQMEWKKILGRWQSEIDAKALSRKLSPPSQQLQDHNGRI